MGVVADASAAEAGGAGGVAKTGAVGVVTDARAAIAGTPNSLGVISVAVHSGVESVCNTAVVGSGCTLGGAGSVGAKARGAGGVTETAASHLAVAGGASAVIAIDSGVGGVGNAAIVGTGGTLGLAVLVAVDNLLDLIDDAGHVD